MNRYIIVCTLEGTVTHVWNGARWVQESVEHAYRFVIHEIACQWVKDHPTVLPNRAAVEVRTFLV